MGNVSYGNCGSHIETHQHEIDLYIECKNIASDNNFNYRASHH